MSLVRRTAKLSLAAQLAANLLILSAFVWDWSAVPPALNTVLLLEGASQAVEFLWYSFVLCRNREFVASERYVDWVVSTPLMLLSLALFFCYRTGGSLHDHPFELVATIVLNEAMLAFGYAVEVGFVATFAGLVAGLVCMLGSFIALAAFAHESLSRSLHTLTLLVWSCYGGAALLRPELKNAAYNLLDIVSKNCFGVFLSVYAIVAYGS